jgi:hypothetical protein
MVTIRSFFNSNSNFEEAFNFYNSSLGEEIPTVQQFKINQSSSAPAAVQGSRRHNS